MKLVQNQLILLFSIIFIGQSMAQVDKATKKRKVHQVTDLQFGIRAGFNNTTPSGVDIETTSSFTGFHAGAFTRIPIQKNNLILEVGALYSQKGYDKAYLFGDDAAFTFQADTVGASAPGKLTANYIDIPVILKDNQSKKFSPFAGIEFNILLDSEYQYSYINPKNENELIVDTQTNLSDLKNFNMAALLGLEYHINHLFNLNLVYSYGLSTIDKGNNVKLKINTIRFSGSFSF